MKLNITLILLVLSLMIIAFLLPYYLSYLPDSKDMGMDGVKRMRSSTRRDNINNPILNNNPPTHIAPKIDFYNSNNQENNVIINGKDRAIRSELRDTHRKNLHYGSFDSVKLETTTAGASTSQKNISSVTKLTSDLKFNDDVTESEKFWAFSDSAKLYTNSDKKLKLRGVFSDYTKLHKSILIGSPSNARLLVVSPSGQLANRLRVIAASIVFGILTDRAVQVSRGDLYADYSELFEMPININNPSFMPSPDESLSFPNGFLCNDLLGDNKRVYGFHGVASFTPLLYLNPKMNEKFIKIFGTFEGLFAAVISYFILPVSTVRTQFLEYREKLRKDSPNAILVGMHIRSGGDFRDGVMPHEDWQRFKKCGELVTSQYQITHKNKINSNLFVATDLDRSRPLATSNFETPSTKIFFYKEFLISNNPAGIQRAFIDLLLVTSADARVLTPGSSYSEFAMSLAGREEISAFVHSTISNMPKVFSYTKVNEINDFCLIPKSTEPSMIELKDFVNHASCGSAIKQNNEKWSLYENPVY